MTTDTKEAEAYAVFVQAIAPAQAAYRRATHVEWVAYKQAKDAAVAEYLQALERHRAGQLGDHFARYAELSNSAYALKAAYERVREPAYAEFERATQAAYDAYLPRIRELHL